MSEGFKEVVTVSSQLSGLIRQVDRMIFMVRSSTSETEVRGVYNRISVAREVAKVEDFVQQTRKQLIRLEYECLSKLVELGAKVASTHRSAVQRYTREDIDRLLLKHKRANTLGGLIIMENKRNSLDRKQHQFQDKFAKFPSVSEIVNLASYSDGPFTLGGILRESTEQVGFDLPDQMTEALKYALKERLRRGGQVTIRGVGPLPQFISFVNESGERCRVPTHVATPRQIRASIEMREKQIAELEAMCGRLYALIDGAEDEDTSVVDVVDRNNLVAYHYPAEEE